MISRTGIITAALLVSTLAGAADPEPAWVTEARQSADQFGSRLKQALRGAIQKEGPVKAIEVCQIKAPEIADDLSGPRIVVGRTSLDIRNPDNAPDSWETRMLKDFEQRLKRGADPANIESFAIRDDGGRSYGHWMKAIPTQGLCTTCHGTNIAPDVAEAITAAYPEDRARGFEVGDLRGAFSVEVELETP